MILDGNTRDLHYPQKYPNFIPLLKQYSFVQVGMCISFMNAARPTSIAQVMWNAIQDKEEFVFAEVKYDGERFLFGFLNFKCIYVFI